MADRKPSAKSTTVKKATATKTKAGGTSKSSAKTERPASAAKAAAQKTTAGKPQPNAKLRTKPAALAKDEVVEAVVVKETPKPQPTEKVAPKTPDAPPPLEPLKSSAKPANNTSIWPVLAAAIVGGAISAGATYFIADRIQTDGQTVSGVSQSDLHAVSKSVDSRLNSLQERIDGLAPPESGVDLTEVQAEIDAKTEKLVTENRDLQAKLSALEQKLAETTDRLDRAELMLGEEAVSANNVSLDQISQNQALLSTLEQELSDQAQYISGLKVQISEFNDSAEELSAAKAELAEISEAAEVIEKQADLKLALSQLQEDFENGRPYSDTLAKLEQASGSTASVALSESAETGIISLEQLVKEYPAAARLALKASIRSESGDDLSSKLTTFLKSQIGARSLEEKEGDDPDAVLSRAEAALNRGQLQASVELVKMLPPDGQTAMETWLSDAEKLLAAKSALADLSANIEIEN